jgi:glycosyltransferase involved in cell wall biosynthesis
LTRAPVVSVAMKAYNHERYVEQAVRSVLQQSFDDFELLITDDASTDGTPAVIERFTDPRIRFERFSANHGIAAAMNATVARARGEFVAILNSDDAALPDRFATQVAFLRERPDVAAVFSVPLQIGEHGEPVAGFGSLFDIPFQAPDASRAAWLRHFFFHGNCLCAPSAMIRRSALTGIGPDDARLAHLLDLDRWIRLLERHEIHVLERPLTAFRIRAGLANASADRSDTRLRDAFESFQIFKRYRYFKSEFLQTIFAEDIARDGIDPTLPNAALLGEVALAGGQVWHPLFALDGLFEAPRDMRDVRRIRELSGRFDAFRIFAPRAPRPD